MSLVRIIKIVNKREDNRVSTEQKFNNNVGFLPTKVIRNSCVLLLIQLDKRISTLYCTYCTCFFFNTVAYF